MAEDISGSMALHEPMKIKVVEIRPNPILMHMYGYMIEPTK